MNLAHITPKIYFLNRKSTIFQLEPSIMETF